MSANDLVVKSPIASAMGASIRMTGPGRGMYFVIGKSMSLDTLVKSAGGEIVLRLNGLKMLATLPFVGYLSLRSNRYVSHIGPVTVDVKRLAKLAGILSKTAAPGANRIV